MEIKEYEYVENTKINLYRRLSRHKKVKCVEQYKMSNNLDRSRRLKDSVFSDHFSLMTILEKTESLMR